MRIIFKYIIKNIREKKFRTFLILFSIMLSAGLFFASSAVSNTMGKMYLDRMKKYFGTAEVMIHSNEKSPSSFFHMDRAKNYENHMEYVIGTVEGGATYKPSQKETVQIDLKGYELEDLQRMNPIVFYKSSNLEDFKGKQIILSRVTVEKYGLELGKKFEVEINGQNHRFQIAGIAEALGPFQEDGRTVTAVVPREFLSSLYGNRGKVSVIYMKTKNPQEESQLIERLSQDYGRYTVRETVTEAEIGQYTSQMTAPFMMMTTIVLFMSIFIIYTSFKVITLERLPTLGTFRSIGATKKMTDLVLMAESIFYGIVGGMLGCGLGPAILYVMTYTMADNPWSGIRMKTEIQFTSGQLMTTFLLALILAFVSALLPIIKISKIPVKDIILNHMDRKVKKRSLRKPLGILFLVISVTAPQLVPRNWALMVGMAGMLLSGTGVTLLIPTITHMFLRVFEKIYFYLFKNEGVLAAKNLRDNKSILNNIALLSIGISSLLMINTISSSVMTELMGFYQDANFEVWLQLPQADRQTIQRIQRVEGVKETYGVMGSQGVELAGTKNKINLLQGIDTNRFLDYWNLEIDRSLLKELDQGRNILLTYTLKDKFGVEIGEELSLKTEKGNKSYRVVGFFNCLRWTGNYALISEKYLKSDMKQSYFDEIYVKTYENPQKIQNELKEKFARQKPFIETLEKMKQNEMIANGQLFSILKGFSIMTMIIGVFGVLNNLIISFIERKRSLAIYRSLGMSKKQIIKMICIEALSGGIIGGIVGAFAGALMISIVPQVMKAIDLSIPIHYSGKLFVYSVLSGILIKIIASISPALKTSKLNIIEAIKYE